MLIRFAPSASPFGVAEPTSRIYGNPGYQPGRLKPLGHPSTIVSLYLIILVLLWYLLSFTYYMNEGVGCALSLRSFRLPVVAEPTSRFTVTPLQAGRLKPLGHPSAI